MCDPLPLPPGPTGDEPELSAKEVMPMRPPRLRAMPAGDDDAWEDTFDREGRPTGQINSATGAFRPLPRVPAQSPEAAAAEGLLPEALRPSVPLADGRLVDPLTYLTLQGLKQSIDAQLITRELDQAGSRARNAGKPLAPIWVALDELSFDRQLGQEFRQAASDTLARATALSQQRQALLDQIAAGLVAGTAAPYQDAQEAREREQQLFELSLSPDERIREHEVRLETLHGQQRLAEKRLEAEVAQAQDERDKLQEQIVELLASRAQIQATIVELDGIYQQDPSDHLERTIGHLMLLDRTLGEYVGGTPEQRESARKRLIQQNAPALWNDVQALLMAQVRQARQEARKPPEKRQNRDRAA